MPYWTFDADTKTAYTGERGTVYYETRTVTRNGKTMTERVQRIRWSYKSGRVKRWFDDVLVLASKSLPPKHTEALEPWSLGDLKPHSSAYLSEFLSESYVIYLDEGYDRAQEKMEAVIRRDVRFDIGGDRQRIITWRRTSPMSPLNTSFCLFGWPLINFAVKVIGLWSMVKRGAFRANGRGHFGKSPLRFCLGSVLQAPWATQPLTTSKFKCVSIG